ncbi:MAG: divalent metal cation transporter, partial [Phycisphaeraceae bacterium]
MLCAIAYVALSTEKSPFQQINQHINPVLGWGWAIATLMANLVWAMPQFSLGTAALQQNLRIIPDTDTGKWIGIAILFTIGAVMVWAQSRGGKGVKIFEWIIKAMVGVVVISFFAVVVAMSLSSEGLAWGDILSGFVPDASMLNRPSHVLAPFVQASTDAAYWTEQIVSQQRDRMVAAAATAVGINMTFLLPFSMLKRGWNRDFRGLATFDLSTGLFIPFMLATSCVVIAAAAQFHARPEAGLLDAEKRTPAVVKLEGAYKKNLDGLLVHTLKEDAFKKLTEEQKAHDAKVKTAREEMLKTQSKEAVAAIELKDPNLGLGRGALDQARNNLTLGDKTIAATMIQRDAFALANSLESVAGKEMSQYVFGIGVVGMAVSTIIILMLINGFTICEMLGRPSRGPLYLLACMLPGISGALGFMYLWTGGEAQFYLAVPTSNFGMILLPIAYIAFFFMMNSRKILGDEIPRGGKRVVMNVLMLMAVALALTGATISILSATGEFKGTGLKIRDVALIVIGLLVLLGVAVHFMRKKPA